MWKETVWKQTLDQEGEPVLTLSITLPAPEGERRRERRMAEYYIRLARLWRSRWTGVLYPRALAALAEARECSRPFQPWEASLTGRCTLDAPEQVSGYVDATERRGGGRALTVRSGLTWGLRSGAPVGLGEILRSVPHWRRWALDRVQEQALDRLQGGESLYYEDVEDRAAAHFSPRRFYLTGEGVVLFYPMWSLGSPAEGVPTFLLPWEEIRGVENFSPEKS